MADGTPSYRWLILGGVVLLGVGLVAVFPRTADAPDDSAKPTPPPADVVELSDTAQMNLPTAKPAADAGQAVRRVLKDCDPVQEALKYKDLVDKRALIALSWDRMTKRAADLKIPSYIVSVENGFIHARFQQFPAKEMYLNVWQTSGHMKPAPKNGFLLDPCSATLEPWPAASGE